MNVYFRRKYLEQMNLDVMEVRITANASVDPSNLFTFTIPDDLYQDFDTDNPREINYLAYAELTPDSPEVRLFETGKILQIDITLSNGTTYEIDGSKFYKEWMNTFKVPLLVGNPNVGEISVPFAVRIPTDDELEEDELTQEPEEIGMMVMYDPGYFSDCKFSYKAGSNTIAVETVGSGSANNDIVLVVDDHDMSRIATDVSAMDLTFTFNDTDCKVHIDKPTVSRISAEHDKTGNTNIELVSTDGETLVNRFATWLS